MRSLGKPLSLCLAASMILGCPGPVGVKLAGSKVAIDSLQVSAGLSGDGGLGPPQVAIELSLTPCVRTRGLVAELNGKPAAVEHPTIDESPFQHSDCEGLLRIVGTVPPDSDAAFSFGDGQTTFTATYEDAVPVRLLERDPAGDGGVLHTSDAFAFRNVDPKRTLLGGSSGVSYVELSPDGGRQTLWTQTVQVQDGGVLGGLMLPVDHAVDAGLLLATGSYAPPRALRCDGFERCELSNVLPTTVKVEDAQAYAP